MRESVRYVEVVLHRRTGADVAFKIHDQQVDRVFLYYTRLAGKSWKWTDATVWTARAVEHNLHPYTYSPGVGEMPEKLAALILKYKPKED